MAPQTSYSINTPAVSYPGQLADNMNGRDMTSALAVAAAMVYGVLAITDQPNTNGFDSIACRVPNAAVDITTHGVQLGVVVADQCRAQDPSVATPQYPINSAVPVLRKGRIWVLAETAMADGSIPFVRYAAGAGGTVLGSFRADADTATAAQLPPSQAVVRGTTTGPGYCVIEVNLV